MSHEPSPIFPGASSNVVALAASAGGLDALLKILSVLPTDFPAGIVLVQHLDPHSRSRMAEIFANKIRLAAREAAAGDRIEPGLVLIAPPGRHLTVGPNGRLRLTDSPPVHFVRPAADVLFPSVADAFGKRAIAVVLTGAGVDGAAGVLRIKAGGGRVIAQDEATSNHFGMPGAAIRTGCVDLVLPLGRIAPALVELVSSGAIP